MPKIIWSCSKCGEPFSFIFEGEEKEVKCPHCGNDIKLISDRQMRENQSFFDRNNTKSKKINTTN